MKKIEINKNQKKILKGVLFVFLFSLLIGRTLFSKSLFRTDDLELHGARLGNYYLALKQGQFPPYWAPNLYYGFGYPVFVFFYHFPYLSAVVFYSLGLSIEASLNVVLFLFLLIGGLGVFTFSYLKNKKIFLAIVSSAVYQTAPYMLLNLFVRGAIGEISFLSFLPWVFVLIKTRDKADNLWHFVFSILIFSALILSHPPSLMIFTPVILGWLLIDGYLKELKNWKKNKSAIFFLISAIISLSITAFSWSPFLLERQYVVADDHHIVKNFTNRFLPIKHLIFSKWGYGGADFNNPSDPFPATLGFSILIILFLSLKEKLKKNKELYFWLIVFFVSIFLMLPISKGVWNFSKVLPFLQYPWRIFGISVFAGVMLFNYLKIEKKIILFILMIISFHHAIFYAKPLSYIQNTNHDWLEYHGTSTSDNEFRTKWFDEFKNIGVTEKVLIEGESTRGGINELFWTGSKMIYEIESTRSAEVVQKTMYFPGWEVSINNQKIDIDYQNEKYPGRIIFSVNEGKNLVEAKFTNNTFSRKLGIYLFILGSGLFGVILLLIIRNKK